MTSLKSFWKAFGIVNAKPICWTKYYWKSGMLVAAERKTKIKRKWENDENQEKPVLMEDIGNLRLQILEEFRNMKSSFLPKVKSLKNEFLQPCVKHSPGEQIHVNSTSERNIERFINHLEEQISFLREQLTNKDKILNSLIGQISKKTVR